MSRRALALAAAGLLAAFGARPAAAQDWRTLDVSRQSRDTAAAPLHVRVNYAAGKAEVKAADAGMLYRMGLRYDARRGAPLHAWDSAGRVLRLGFERQGSFVGTRDADGALLQLGLARSVPLDLSLELGAVAADLNLTGLRLEALTLSTGASETRLRFDTLNQARMRALDLQVGAASFRATGLANANADRVHVKGGVGEVDLDFGGQWTRDVDLTVEMALGGVVVRVPREVGVRLELNRFLSSFDHDGMTKRDGAWVSGNWDTARHHVRIKSQSALGTFRLDHR